MENVKHKHSFSVDTSCECGVMLSEYVRSLVSINADLLHAVKGSAIIYRELHEAFIKAGFPPIKDADFVLNKLDTVIQKAES